MVRWLVLLVGCNGAPVDYTDVGSAPGAVGAWGGPSELACDAQPDAESDLVVGGFTLCGREHDIVPIDDPVLEPCDPDPVGDPDAEVFYVFDGLQARAYVIEALKGRELVHDEWGELPIIVDW